MDWQMLLGEVGTLDCGPAAWNKYSRPGPPDPLLPSAPSAPGCSVPAVQGAAADLRPEEATAPVCRRACTGDPAC